MYDQALAQRIRELLHAEPNVREMHMFGGLAFLVNGNMCVSASGQGGLLLHVDPGDADALVAEPYAQAAVMRGRVMQGWLRVDAGGVQSAAQLEHWVMRGVVYARSLPAKRLSGRPETGDIASNGADPRHAQSMSGGVMGRARCVWVVVRLEGPDFERIRRSRPRTNTRDVPSAPRGTRGVRRGDRTRDAEKELSFYRVDSGPGGT